MKLLFLDIDGVISVHESFLRRELVMEDLYPYSSAFNICPTRASRVQEILDATSAKLIISSSWRRCYKDILPELLHMSGIHTRIYDETPWIPKSESHDMNPREFEIYDYLTRPSVSYTNFLILDDDTSFRHHPDMRMRTIKTSYFDKYPGLSEVQKELSIKILNNNILT